MATVPELIVERQKEISKGWESFSGIPCIVLLRK